MKNIIRILIAVFFISGTAFADTQTVDINTFAELQSWVSDETLLKAGNLTDAKYCIWDDGNGDIVCNSTPAGEGDAFLVNDANDTMVGILTADGLTLGANENITLGTQTLDHDGTDFVFSDSVNTGANAVKTTVNITGEPKHLRFNIFDPNGAQSDDGEICIIPETDSAFTVTKLTVTLDSTVNQISGDLKYADTFIGLANATVINDFDTTSGVREDSSITSGAVAAGKAVYISFDSAPNAAITQASFDVQYDYD